MNIVNYAPFPSLYFPNRDVRGKDRGVFVMQGTFFIKPGQVLLPHQQQEKLRFTDAFRGELNQSSLLADSSLVPFKPNTDIYLNAVAHAPGGRPISEMKVGVHIGELSRELRVTGRRTWNHKRLRGWRLSEPEPFVAQPLNYEYAFGGTYRRGDNTVGCMENPVGLGFFDPRTADRKQPIEAPRIEKADEPIETAGLRYEPAGLGPIGRAWQPRLKHAGTYDENWQKNRAPLLPDDYDEAFNNCAHPDMIYPGYLQGNETVTLEGMRPDGESLSFQLPQYQVGLLLRHVNGRLLVVTMVIDTLFIDIADQDPAKNRVTITWRGMWEKKEPIRVLESRLIHPGMKWMEQWTWQ